MAKRKIIGEQAARADETHTTYRMMVTTQALSALGMKDGSDSPRGKN